MSIPAEPSELAGLSRAEAPADLPRRLSLLSTIAVTVGLIVGSGIFRAPSTVAEATGSDTCFTSTLKWN